MSKDLIISISGLRGIVGQSLTPLVAMRFAAAFANELPAGSVVVSRDGRDSGSMLAEAVRSALRACGRDVVEVGVAATPTVGILVRTLGAVGGVQISASHNERPYNGMKLLNADGRVLPAEQGQRVLHRYRQGPLEFVNNLDIGVATELADTTSAHLERVLATVNGDRIRQRNYHVVLDSNHGAGSLLGRRLLESLGCRVTVLGETADGQFEHTPEPTETNLVSVGPRIAQLGADVGFCQDPDADRLAVIDQQGVYLGEEYTLALCLDHILQHSAGDRATVVTNCATSRMCEDIAQRHGARLIRSAVGEAHVVQEMVRHDAVFGGEGNGGPIDPRVGFIRDSFVGMAQILDAMAARDATPRQLADSLPKYGIYKTHQPLDSSQVEARLAALTAHFSDATVDRQDGLRFDWPDRWLLVRPSNTEPFVRFIAEAPQLEQARQLAEEAGQVS